MDCRSATCPPMRILGIETSCDETAAAVVEDGPSIVTNVVHSQIEAHAPFGGVVPEIASREHIGRMTDIVTRAVEPLGGMEAIDGIAVTTGPGLVGCLLVGVQMAKGLAMARGVPWVGINHLEGHLSAALLASESPSYPHVALVVSGGHTHLYHVRGFGEYELLGGTRDDAAGEAFLPQRQEHAQGRRLVGAEDALGLVDAVDEVERLGLRVAGSRAAVAVVHEDVDVPSSGNRLEESRLAVVGTR